MKKKFLRSLLSVVLALGILFSVPFGSNALIGFFEDISDNVSSWYYMPIYRLYYGNVYPRCIYINEMYEFDFHPERSISRGVFVALLAETARKMGKETNLWEETSPSQPTKEPTLADYMKWAEENDILFEPSLDGNEPMTRQEMAVFLIRFKEYMDIELPGSPEDAGYEKFSDKDDVAGWAVEGMKECYRLKLLSGKKMKDGTLCLAPEHRTTRAEASQAVINYIDAVGFELELNLGGWTDPDGMYVPG